MMTSNPLGEEKMGIERSEPFPKQNPLLLEPVLDCLFKFCKIEDHRNFRLVCKTWHDAVLPLWRKNCPSLRLTGERAQDGDRDDGVERIKFSSYLELLYDPEKYFEFAGRRKSQDVSLASFVITMDSTFMPTFKYQMGQWITYLNLSQVLFKDKQSFKDVMCSKWTPKLKILNVEVEYEFENVDVDLQKGTLKENKNMTRLILAFGNEKMRGSLLPISWLEMLEIYPNLRFLSIRHTSRFWNKEMEELLIALKTLRETKQQILPLKVLHIGQIKFSGDDDQDSEFGYDNFSVASTVCQLLKDELAYFSMQWFSISLAQGQNDSPKLMEGFRGIVKVVTPTLREFVLDTYCDGFDLDFFPRMESLIKLRITGHISFSNLTFLKFFPKLKELELDEQSDNCEMIQATRRRDMAGVVMKKLKTFKYPTETNPCSPEDIRKLARWMPNLESLKLYLTNDTFRMVCQKWPNLKELTTVGDELDDEGITGIPVNAENSAPIFPNITMLRNLSSFTAGRHSFADSCSNDFTDKSVFEGFLKLEKLERLDFMGNEAPPISDAAVAMLRERVKTCYFGLKDN